MESIILIISAFITSSISAVLGMGGGIILLGIMAILIPEGYMVIALHGIIQLVSNATRTFVFRSYLIQNLIKEFFIGAIIGLTFSGLIIYLLVLGFDVQSAKELKVDFLKPVIGIFILWYLYLKGPKKKKDSKTFSKVGLISGFSTVFIGATGPLIAPFFINDKFSKENIIANKAACQVISHLGKIPLLIFFFKMDYFAESKVLIPLIIAVLIGTNLGKHILQFIPENIFKKVFKILLTVISLKLIFLQ